MNCFLFTLLDISSLVALALLFPTAGILHRRLARRTAVEIGGGFGNET